ncbi:MAG: hypothetical protein JWO48_1242 [Bryobacterales bacterium]|nr:hypothetical protein [Bryobacterales bacterium]
MFNCFQTRVRAIMEMAFLKVDCARRHSNFPQGRKMGKRRNA